MLSTCEARFVSVPLRGNALLPEWLRDGRAVAAGAAEGDEAEASSDDSDSAAAPAPAAAAAGGKPQKVRPVRQAPLSPAEVQQQEGAKAAAEAVAAVLNRAGCKPVGVRQLLFGDHVVVYRFMDSGQVRQRCAARIPGWLGYLPLRLC